jgi:threonine synthase
VEQASEEELANAAARSDKTGMYCCPHTGVALAVLFKLVERGDVGPRDRVIVISTAHGLKFTDFKVDYHDRALKEVVPRYDNPPLELAANYRVVKEAIARELDRRGK